MSKLKICFDRNKLSLNFNKTKILFGNCGVNIQEQVQIDGAQIERVHANKFLVVREMRKSVGNHTSNKYNLNII